MTTFSLNRPYYVVACAIVLLVLGIISALNLPVQLLPEISKNEIVVTNSWPQASPEEVEREITEPMEELLSKINGVIEYKSDISLGRSKTRLRFASGTDMNQAYIDVIDRVNQIKTLPKTALEPKIQNLAINNRGSVATLLLSPKNKEIVLDRDDFTRIYEQQIKNSLLSIEGVKGISVALNPTEKRISVRFDPHRLAMYEVTLEEIKKALNNSLNSSGGQVEQGGREFTVRFKGRVEVDDLYQIVVKQKAQRDIRLGELAQVSFDYVNDSNPVFWNGKNAFYISIFPASNANTLSLIESINIHLQILNRDVLGARGMILENSSDDSKNIVNAMDMLKGNLLLGIVLATIVLFAFIRSKTTILIIFSSLPLSILCTFIVLSLLDRSFNIISIAGVALSTGMILDAAIVIVDSIVRRKEQGMSTLDAVCEGAGKVSGALITSVVSSVVVFIPIALMESAEGQLFHDLAITISVALVSSLLVSMSVIPLLLKYFLNNTSLNDSNHPIIDKSARLISRSLRNKKIALTITVLLFVVPVIGLKWAMPHAEVLPQVKGNIAWGYFSFNQSLNDEAVKSEIIQPVITRIEQHIASGEAPNIHDYLIYSDSDKSATILVKANEDTKASEIKSWLRSELAMNDSLFRVYSGVESILRTSLSNSREVSIDIGGINFEHLQDVGKQVKALVREAFPDVRVRTNIPLELANPTYVFTPINERIFSLGENQQGLSTKLAAMNYGSYVTEYFDGNETLPLFLQAHEWQSVDQLLDAPFFYPEKGSVPLRSMLDYQLSVSAQELFRLNGHRTLSVKVTTPDGVALQDFIAQLKEQVGPQITPLLSNNEFFSYRGSASRLQQLLGEMQSQFLFATLLLLLLVIALFQSVKYGVLCLLSLPIAIFGGALSLQLTNLFVFQPMDIITMLGFIILIGLVINNAILFVEFYRTQFNEHADHFNAIESAVKSRSRAILMSSLTSIFGMLPLALLPGTGVEIYRGLAVIIATGMLCSLLFSLPVLSALLTLTRHFGDKTEMSSQFNKEAVKSSLSLAVSNEKQAMSLSQSRSVK
ncbi:Cobalt-zinc-cadmium resistance protein CzcA [Pseudoalteromonas holothuriae]|uniref:Cobalt-zinc-cadmium resistance protein CzcA n=1 Tax=Pseudoalteromonas holothuriae TaxID=2963714 RepID=A0ABM9GLN7_9GAMM|nr:efflux RND transporter permease subunit [Pseudoalteromonas sp. CIP111951]CAH9063399.1 Cobalt-zinc-cadmium resistance protein CzcA [Pseudoalteromonas sp. CIP111951]